MFGSPRFDVVLHEGVIVDIRVQRGAPCGATWLAAERMTGLAAEIAGTRIGLETQFFCAADPAGWDPISGKSPVHFAGHVHRKALERAVSSAMSDP